MIIFLHSLRRRLLIDQEVLWLQVLNRALIVYLPANN